EASSIRQKVVRFHPVVGDQPNDELHAGGNVAMRVFMGPNPSIILPLPLGNFFPVQRGILLLLESEDAGKKTTCVPLFRSERPTHAGCAASGVPWQFLPGKGQEKFGRIR